MELLWIGFLISCVVGRIESYSWGLDRTACDFFTPSHIGVNRRPEDGYYKLSTEKVMFSAGETIEIKVTGKDPSDDYTYTGILISVRKDDESFGVWEQSFDYAHIDCSNKVGSAISEVDDEFPKVVGQHTFKWTAPDSCVTNDIYYVKATVVKAKREFLDGLVLPLKCVLAPDNYRNDSCSREFQVIPKGANTSFELSEIHGWTNKTDVKLSWRSWEGPTPSPGTGPKIAYDGDRYMYVEASFPAEEGQQAVLVSPQGLAGCLCFRFAYHMYTDIITKFYCEVNGVRARCQHPDFNSEGDNGVPMDKSRDKWISSWLSINEPGAVEVKIIAQRGTTFRGDIALDDFSFSPGSCEEDRK